MTENKAFLLDIVVGCAATWGSVILLDAVGANDGFQLVAAMLGLAGTAFMIGVIGYFFERKGERSGEDREG
jgi:hypothetical protein